MKKLIALIVFLALTFPASAQDYDPQHTMLALNMAIVSVHRILTTESRAVLEEEYSNIINNLSLGNIESDRDMTELYRDMLGTITRKRVSEGDSRRLKSYYDTAKQRLIAYALSDIRMSEAKLKAATNATNDAAQDLQRVKNSQYLTVAGWLGKMAVSCVPALWGGNIFLIGKLFKGFSIATAAAATVDSYKEYDKTVEPRKRAERNYRIAQEAQEQQEIRLARLKEGLKHDEAMLKEELQNSLWKLERQDIAECNALQERLLQSSWNLLRKYSLPDSYRLTQNTLKNFYRAVQEEDTSRRSRMLRNLEDEFSVYPPYWFYRAKAAQESGNLTEARKYYAEFEKVWRPVLRRDPYMLETAKFRIQDLVSEGHEIDEVRPKILEHLETVYANTPKDDWADNLFMGVAYFLLGEKSKGMHCLAVNLDFGYEEKISGILFAQMEKGALDSDEAQEVIHSMRLSELVTSMKIADGDSAVAMALYFEGNNDALERMSKSSGNPIVFHALRLIEQLKGSAGNYARVIEYVKKHDSLRDKIDEAYSEIAPLVKNYADEGRENAKIFMADMLMYGWGIEQDTKKAEEIFTELAENGNVYAQFMMVQSPFAPVSKKQQTLRLEEAYQMGWKYFSGYTGIKQSYMNAVGCFMIAAEGGHSEAQYMLGFCYHRGFGVNRNLLKAREWYEKAAKQGHAKARQHLEAMNKNGE